MKNTNPNFQHLAFAGGLYDQDTKFLRFGARDYDPTIGRWTTKDPVEFDSGDTNLYAYVSGNPTSMIDPDGESGLPGAFVGAAFEIAIQAANLKAQGKDVYDYKNYDGYDIAIAAAVGAIAPGILNLGKTSLKSSLAIKTLSKQLKNAKTLNRVAKVQSRIAKNRNKIAKIVATQSAYQIVKTKLKKVNNPSCE
ncbi:MAG: RHS repeat-associated core domain-containing protein [Pseudobdellovibrio sp.]|nr:RHS repeat-associated core domain-containing protein [Pseudobdellovibrio sp.]